MILLALALSACASSALAQVDLHFDFGPPPPHGGFWEGAPPTLGERIHLVDVRMQRLHDEGRINSGEWFGDQDEFNRIHILYEEFQKFEGGPLTPREHAWLWARLDKLAQRLHWQSGYGY
jgi:hypothetical protein